jgi:hypothetical protein
LSWFAIGGLALTVATSASPRTSLEAALPTFLALVLFVFVVRSGVGRFEVAVGLVAVATVISVVVLAEFIGDVLDWYRTMDLLVPEASLREKLPVGLLRTGFSGLVHNFTAMVGVVSLPVAVYLWKDERMSRAAAGLSIASILAMVIVTGSRAGLLAAIAGLAIAIVGLSWAHDPERVTRSLKWLAGAGGLLMVLIVIVFVSGIRPEFLFRATLEDRLPVMAAGWQMFLDNPVVGNGPGSFHWLVDSYLGPPYSGARSLLVWNNAHNGYVQVLAESGVVGAVALVGGLMVVAARSAWFLVSRRGSDLGVAAACLGSLVGLALHSLVDVSTLGLAPLSFIAVVAGLAWPDDGESHGRPGLRTRVATLLFALSVGILPLVGLSAFASYDRGVEAAWRGDWQNAASAFGEASSRDSLPLYGRLESHALLEMGAEIDLDEARRQAEGVPSSTSSWLNLSRAELRAGHALEPTLDELVERLPREEVTYLELGALSDSLGDQAGADGLFSRALLMNPWLAGSDFWVGLDGGEERVERVYEGAVESSGCAFVDVFVVMGIWTESVGNRIESCPEGSAAAIAMLIADGDFDRALVLVRPQIAAQPDSTALRRLAGLAAHDSGDLAEAKRNWGIAALLGDSWSAWQLGLIYAGDPQLEIQSLLRASYRGNSPVIVGAGPVEVYRFDVFRIDSFFRREPPPRSLVAGDWVQATTQIHEGILKLLEES